MMSALLAPTAIRSLEKSSRSSSCSISPNGTKRKELQGIVETTRLNESLRKLPVFHASRWIITLPLSHKRNLSRTKKRKQSLILSQVKNSVAIHRSNCCNIKRGDRAAGGGIEEEEGNDLGSGIFFGGARRAGRPIGVAVSAYWFLPGRGRPRSNLFRNRSRLGPTNYSRGKRRRRDPTIASDFPSRTTRRKIDNFSDSMDRAEEETARENFFSFLLEEEEKCPPSKENPGRNWIDEVFSSFKFRIPDIKLVE